MAWETLSSLPQFLLQLRLLFLPPSHHSSHTGLWLLPDYIKGTQLQLGVGQHPQEGFIKLKSKPQASRAPSLSDSSPDSHSAFCVLLFWLLFCHFFPIAA